MPIDTHHPEYDKALPDWTRNRVVVEGERAVKAAGTTYLPRLSGQTFKIDRSAGKMVDEYEAYKDRAAFFPATSRTLDGMAGLIFRKDPQAKLPAVLEKYANDIDMRGLSLNEFASKLVNDVFPAPHGGILVEFPQTDGVERVQSDAEALGYRPYLTYWPAESVINWRTGRVNNRTVTTEVRLYETVSEPDPEDPYTDKLVEQIRLLELADVDGAKVYRVTLFRKAKDETTGKEEWKPYKSFVPYFRGKVEPAIPFVFVGPKDTSPDVQKAPLSDIAGVNVALYKNSADYENGLHWIGVPTPVFIGDFIAPDGEKVTEVKLGSASGIQMSQGSDAKFLEFQGSGLDAIKQAMADKKDDMAVLGARILAADKKQAEAAETAAIHRVGENSVLASIANAVSRALETALGIMARWAGDETSEISYRLNTDYQPVPLNYNDLTALVKAWQAGALSEPELFEALVEGEVIRDDKDHDEHVREVEAEAEAKAAKDAEKAEAELARTAGALANAQRLSAGQLKVGLA